ncbi:MAG: ATP-binding cassette domain-containing protein [Patescibacteria group bacterium]|nr:ATP-binding cassette domain-containing protein [Patescibacteria group bacterium]
MLNIIQVKNLSKKFNNFIAVDDISFKVKKGEILAFLGPNGAGKTTTIKMLTTLINPTKGFIKVNGFNPQNNKDKVRKSFGIVFQDSSLDEELTALENMQFHSVLYKVPKEVRKKRIKELLTMIGLWTRKNDFVKTFSGGMKRRLEIARGLLHRPKILFLDEPTLGLDPQTRNKIWTHINQLNKKYQITVFFTTHYMEEAEKMAKKIAIIDHGKIIAQGTVEKLKTKTKTDSLENAFIKLTGKAIREEKADNLDKMRMFRKKRFGKR